MKRFTLWMVAALLFEGRLSHAAASTLQQLNHKAWTVANGAPGVIYAITQSTDGTLWLAGPNGLSRFDGVTFVRYVGSPGQPFESTYIRTIAAKSDGGLWIGFNLGGISLLKNGTIIHYGERDGLPVTTVTNIVTDQNGITYAATTQGLYSLRHDIWERITVDANNLSARAVSAAVDRTGTLWVVTDTGVWVRPVAATHFVRVASRGNLHPMSARSLAAAPDGKMWIRNLNRMGGMTRLDGPTDPTPSGMREFSFEDTSLSSGIFFDRQGNLWMGGNAVRRVAPAALSGDLNDTAHQMENFTVADGLTGWTVTCFFEDLEGNIWVGTYAGLDRFSPSNVTRVIYPNPAGGVAATAGEHGTVWASSRTMSADGNFPIFEIHDGKVVKEYPQPPFTSAYRSPDGSVWFGGASGIGRFEQGRWTPTALPYQDDVQAMIQDRSGAMWVSVVREGVFRLANGRWSAYGDLPDLPRSPVIVESTDFDGRLWFGYTGNRIARIDGRRVEVFGAAQGLNVGSVTAISAARGQHQWIGGEHGVAIFDGARFSSILSERKDLFTGISGIVEVANGDLWMNGNIGIAHITKDELQKMASDSAYRVRCEVFDYLDGMPGYAKQLRPTPSAFEGTDGQLWFVTENGLVSINPTRISHNTLPPPVTIWTLSAAGTDYPAALVPLLPPHTTSLRIDYTAGSFIIPEHVRFRYKLEGLDVDWQDAGNRREATYTNLGPDRYTFRVIAANNDGVWNNSGALLRFTIAPAFYQTQWFYAICGLLGALALAALYRLRMRQIARAITARFDERLAERTRLARELHDTLLQSIQGSKIMADGALVQPVDLERMTGAMHRLSQWLGQAIQEGRAALNSLRTSTVQTNELADALRAVIAALQSGRSMTSTVSIRGDVRPLHPIARDEVYLIGNEAIRNAYLHSTGNVLTVDIDYGRDLTVLVIDNGVGIDPGTASKGKEGHFGLQGMRERAQRLEGELRIDGSKSQGTIVTLMVPGIVIYTREQSLLPPWLRRMITALAWRRGHIDRE